jgi:hypothetical protein
VENYVQPHQNTIAQSLDYRTAQSALSALQSADFSLEQFSLMPEEIDSNATINETEAAKGAGAGALTGSVFGSLMGGLFAYAETLSGSVLLDTTHLLGLMLAGSGVGAAAVSILGALTGVNVHKGQDTTAPIQQYALLANVDQGELMKAQEVLQQAGITTLPN